MAKITISDLTAAFASTTALNAKFQQIEDALNNLVLYRDNTGTPGEPNSMSQDLDLDGFDILNVGNVTSTGTPSIDADNVIVVPAGNIAATDAQAAIEELDAEKAKIAGDATQVFNTASLGVTGNVTVSGNVDGRDVAGDGTKLDGIEAGATTDQTASDIKTAYESNIDTNAFTDTFDTFLTDITATAAD